jgi:hypothetical protein
MVRFLYILGVLAFMAACTILVFYARRQPSTDPQLDAVLNGLGAAERLGQEPSGRCVRDRETPPLVRAAQTLSLYLSPPKGPEKPTAPAPVASSGPSTPTIRPAAPSVRFRLCATGYYPSQPERSMALIAEFGSGPGSERWVKEGTQVGHFVIHEIRRGAIIYRDGDNLREMAVEHGASLPSVVRDLRPGSVRVSAAIGDTGGVISVPTGPNGIEIAGGN